MPGQMAATDFVGKVLWGKGILAALDLGLTEEALRPRGPYVDELRAAWAELRALYEPMRPVLDRVQRLVNEIDEYQKAEYDRRGPRGGFR